MEEDKKSISQIKKELEAIIFVSPEVVDQRKLAEVIGCGQEQIKQATEELVQDYNTRNSGLSLLPVAGGYQIVTSRDMAPVIEKFLTVVRKRRLSQAALETLSIIAYRQPVTRPEIESIRGVDSSAVVQGLLEKKLVRLGGRRKAPGRPLTYRTTRHFLVHFGMKDLKELPALSELGRPQLPEEDGPEEEA